MANVAAGTVWNLPNYIGEIFTASRLETPLLNVMGGLNGLMQTDNFQFPIEQNYSHETAAQPAITETASLTAPTAISYVRSQVTNVTQIFQEQVSVSYERLAGQGRLSGLNTQNSANPIQDEIDFQTAAALEKIARDVEFTICQGTYQAATAANVANKSRGLIAAAGQTNAAAGATLSKTLIDAILKDLYDNGARFRDAVIVMNSFNKQQLSNAYGYAPTDRNIGGVDIKQIETDFGNIGAILDPFQPAATVTVVTDIGRLKIVTQPVPNKGNLFLEPLAKTGAGEELQLFGKIGIDHGPAANIGTITGLATS
jgi:hypothetical protein